MYEAIQLARGLETGPAGGVYTPLHATGSSLLPRVFKQVPSFTVLQMEGYF